MRASVIPSSFACLVLLTIASSASARTRATVYRTIAGNTVSGITLRHAQGVISDYAKMRLGMFRPRVEFMAQPIPDRSDVLYRSASSLGRSNNAGLVVSKDGRVQFRVQESLRSPSMRFVSTIQLGTPGPAGQSRVTPGAMYYLRTPPARAHEGRR